MSDDQKCCDAAWRAAMGRKIKAKAKEVKEKVIPTPKDPPSTTPTPGMLGSGGAARAAESSREAMRRREKEAGID